MVLGDPRALVDSRACSAGVTLGARARAPRRPGRGRRCSRGAARWRERAGELQRIEPVAAARAEVAWLRGDAEGVADATEAAFALAASAARRGSSASWPRGAGAPGSPTRSPPRSPTPYALQLAGDWKRGRAHWDAIGLPVRRGAGAGRWRREPRAARSTSCTSLGAGPAAAIVARRLRARGARGLRAARGAHARQSRRPHARASSRCSRCSPRGCATGRSPSGSFLSPQDGRPSRRRDPAQARRPHARRGGRGGPAARRGDGRINHLVSGGP